MRRQVFLTLNNGEKYLTENPEKDIMDCLVEKTKASGHLLTFDEVRSDPEMFAPMAYAFYYYNFENAAREAWYKVKPQSPDGLTEAARIMLGRQKKQQTTAKGGAKMPKGKRYNNSEVKAMLLNFYNAHGRFPRITEAKEDNGLPSWGVLTNTLGPRNSWDRLVKTTADDDDGANSDTAPDAAVVTESLPAPEPETANDEASPITEPDPSPKQVQADDVEVDTSCEQKDDDSVTIDLKITVPGREKPILITLTV